MALNGFLFLLKEISNAENKMKIKREGFYQEIIMVFMYGGCWVIGQSPSLVIIRKIIFQLCSISSW